MKRKSILFVAVLALIAFITASGISRASGDLAVGATFDGFTLTDPDGKEHSYKDMKGENGTVLIYLSVQCPVVAGYNDRINQLAADYQAKGINFIGINSNSTESAKAVKAHAAEHYKFPVLIDKNNVLADKMGATVTPEVYYFNAKDILLYEGAIDNDRRGENITDTYARDAFDAGLGGKAIATTSARAFGCTIKRIKN
ncbi:MAG: redoxin domain-containing protein [Pyrinomonadaceae bacterium]